MRWIRDAVCLAALLTMTSLTVWGTVQAARQELPDAETLEPVDLRSWLTERDLSSSSDAVRSRVSRRFDEELHAASGSVVIVERLGARGVARPAVEPSKA